MAIIFCVKCQAYRSDPQAKTVLMKNNRPGVRGKCPICGSKIFQLGTLNHDNSSVSH